jgi:hypothetical protein
MATRLVRKAVTKQGGARYGIEGVRTTAFFPALMFVGEPPAEILVNEETRELTDPQGNPVKNDMGDVMTVGLVFATAATQKDRVKAAPGTKREVKASAELQAARQRAKELREQSKQVLRDARQAAKSRKGGVPAGQTALPTEGTSAAA